MSDPLNDADHAFDPVNRSQAAELAEDAGTS